MSAYHLRRAEKAITEKSEILEIIHKQSYMTLGLCREGQPYLMTVNYGFDEAEGCFYFHCAGEGKKIDYMKANPKVWGQILEDRGYLDGQCDHAYRSIHFAGRVTFVEEMKAKRHALSLMIEHLESNPEAMKARLLTSEKLTGVTIGRVTVESLSGKENDVKGR